MSEILYSDNVVHGPLLYEYMKLYFRLKTNQEIHRIEKVINKKTWKQVFSQMARIPRVVQFVGW